MVQMRFLIVFCFAVALANATPKRYDNNMLLSVTPTDRNQMKVLATLEDESRINLWNDLRLNGSVHVMIDRLNSSWLYQLFETLNLKPQIIIPDVEHLFSRERAHLQAQSRSGVARGILDTFYNYDQLSTWLQEMAATYPTLAKVISIGKTYENRDIWLIKITGNAGGTKKTVFMDFGIHAREWISPATGAYIINQLLTTYASGGDAKTIMDTWELHIVPVLNPDGYAYSHKTDRMWRKNRKPVGSGYYGVDLNRNFGYQWNTGGSSGVVSSDTFHGGSPMSENEAKALQNYMPGKSWTTYLTFHSYGQYWFTNWGYSANILPATYTQLVAKAQIGANAIKAVNGRTYSIGSSSKLLYAASGGSEDWTAGTLGITYSYCLELPPVGGTGFIAPTSEIKKTGDETYKGVVAYLKSF